MKGERGPMTQKHSTIWPLPSATCIDVSAWLPAGGAVCPCRIRGRVRLYPVGKEEVRSVHMRKKDRIYELHTLIGYTGTLQGKNYNDR